MLAALGCAHDEDDGASLGKGCDLRQPAAFSVISNDYETTSISLLDTDGKVTCKDFINSGSASTGLSTALSGDVVAKTPGRKPSAILTLIDRFTVDVITRVDTEDGEVLGQIKTKNDNQKDDLAFGANPQDVYQLSADSAWVSRHSPNEAATDEHPDRGLDLIEFDPTGFERTGKRISFWELNADAERENEDGETETVTAFARPVKIVPIGDRPEQVVVGIASLSAMFDAAGPGMVALVDLEAGDVEKVELPGMQNCGDVVAVPGDRDRVVVACLGFYRGEPRDSAGIALLHLEEDELSIEHVWHAKDDVEAAVAVSNVIALGGTEVIAVAQGSSDAEHDTAYVVDIEDGSQEALFTAEDAYVVGAGAYSESTRLLLIPDASTDAEDVPSAGVRRFRRDEEGRFSTLDTLALHRVLPARLVSAL